MTSGAEPHLDSLAFRRQEPKPRGIRLRLKPKTFPADLSSNIFELLAGLARDEFWSNRFEPQTPIHLSALGRAARRGENST